MNRLRCTLENLHRKASAASVLFGLLLILTTRCQADDLQWVQSYNAGYRDASGAYAGGSEIMHIVSHKKKLYAANGYWVDSRWEIPPDHQKQSAQVLRLDSTNGKWQVDLDLGKSNDHGMRFMKGNILKSISFSQAGRRLLSYPANLLVMASGSSFERGGAVSLWVRNDETGKWAQTIVRHGSSLGGIRWIPRDIEVYRDKVTNEERVFLLLGNPGIISGVYDPTAPTMIRWDNNLEFPFPERGSLRTRPLGITQANGSLFFSEGESVFRRNDGARPTYTEILNLNEDTDTDVGGIRGLTTIENPNGLGESILFLWAPGEKSHSQVMRLDPAGDGKYTLHKEANLSELLSEYLGVKVTFTLGAHNMMYPISDPVTRKTVHLIGFQGRCLVARNLSWKGRLYAGAVYSIRTTDGKYSLHEVNNQFRPGKPPLVSPRAFCFSPFGDNTVFVGGHDSSNAISDDMAWIFKGPIEAVSGSAIAEDSKEPHRPARHDPRWDAGPVYELRIYTAGEKRFDHMVQRFRERTDRLFRKHGLEPLGYWIPTDQRTHRRKFVYVLEHPSRYKSWQNWKSFSNSRDWQNVVNTPRFRGVLSSRPTSVFMTTTESTKVTELAPKHATGHFELRTYTAKQDKLVELTTLYSDKVLPILKKHSIELIACWQAFDDPASHNTLIVLVYHDQIDKLDDKWQAINREISVNGMQTLDELLGTTPASIVLRRMKVDGR